MRILSIVGALVASLALAGCAQTPVERAGAGALAGAAIAGVAGGDVLTGGLIGAGIGAVSCGLPGLPPCRRF